MRETKDTPYSFIFHTAAQAMVELHVDDDGTVGPISAANEAAVFLLGHPERALKSMSLSDLEASDGEGRPELGEAALATALANLSKTDMTSLATHLQAAHGPPIPVRIQLQRFKEHEGLVTAVIHPQEQVTPELSRESDSRENRRTALRGASQRISPELTNALKAFSSFSESTFTEPDREDLYTLIAEGVHQIVGTGLIIVTSMDETTRISRVRHVVGLNPLLNKAFNLLGRRPTHIKTHLIEEERPLLTSGRLQHLEGGVYQMTFRQVPKAVCHAMERALGLGKIYGMGFTRQGKLYGAVAMMLQKGVEPRFPELVEAYTRMASIAVQKQRSLQRQEDRRDQMEQTQKLEAVGRLAGGIAHDFNNLMTVVLGYSDLLLMKYRDQKGVQRHVGQIKKAAERAASLTQRMLAFAGRDLPNPQPIELNPYIEGMMETLESFFGDDCEVVFKAYRGAPLVKMDRNRLQQTLINLASNARDAMPQGGTFTIETRSVSVDWPEFDENAAAPSPATRAERDFVSLTFTDTGEGMNEEDQARIFEPFFTTKEPGSGTGLGLSSVYGIVRNAGGYIKVHSEPGEGTRFVILLPAFHEIEKMKASAASSREAHQQTSTQESEDSIQQEVHTPIADEPLSGAPEHAVAEEMDFEELEPSTVLLVEDQEGVRGLTQKFLEKMGHQVLTAPDGETALEIASSHSDEIDLLLTDVVLPGLNGLELSDALQSRRPGVKTLFMSGYSENYLKRYKTSKEPGFLLKKPFTPTQLAIGLRKSLQAFKGAVDRNSSEPNSPRRSPRR